MLHPTTGWISRKKRSIILEGNVLTRMRRRWLGNAPFGHTEDGRLIRKDVQRERFN